MTLGCKDIGTTKSEFVAKIPIFFIFNDELTKILENVTLYQKKLGPIGSAVLTFSGYKKYFFKCRNIPW